MSDTPNIVQAEFFHEYGPRLKTVVRFFDQHGRLTAHALQAEQLQARERSLSFQLMRKGPADIPRWSLMRLMHNMTNKMHQKTVGEQIAHKEQALFLTITCLASAVQSGEVVALRSVEHNGFCLADRDEQVHAVKSACRGVGVWLFIFEPNDLCADSNEMVASMM